MHRDKNVSSSHELSNKQKKIKIGPLVAEKKTFHEAIWRPSLMAAILVFYTDFQVAPPLESYLLASTNTTASGTFQSKSAAFSGVPDVLIGRVVSSLSLALQPKIRFLWHLVPNYHSIVFYSSLETVLFSRGSILSASDYNIVRRPYYGLEGRYMYINPTLLINK